MIHAPSKSYIHNTKKSPRGKNHQW